MNKVLLHMQLLLAVFFFHAAEAQSGDSGRLWSLTECFQYAIDHNIQISTLRLNEQTAEEDLLSARGLRLPALDATLTNLFENANNELPGNGGRVNQLTTLGNYTLDASLVLWNGRYIRNHIQQEQKRLEAAGWMVQQSKNNLILSITASYLDILLARENLSYLTDLVQTSEAQVKQGQIFFEAGSIAKLVLLQLQAQLAGDQYLRVQAQNAIRKSLLGLKQLLQLPSTSFFDIQPPDTVSIAQTLMPLPVVQETALRDFPDIRIGKMGLDIASLDIAKARAGFKPVLSAGGILGTGYSQVLTHEREAKTGYFTQTGRNFYQRLGFTLSIPIFSNYVNRANLAKAQINYQAARLNDQNAELLLLQAVEEAYLDAFNGIQAYNAAGVQLQFAREAYRISNEEFRLGSIDSYKLLQERNQYIQAVQAFTQAKYTAVWHQKIYEFYKGKPISF
ncbi:MAG: TolC family protein [Flavisolibacter sp.]